MNDKDKCGLCQAEIEAEHFCDDCSFALKYADEKLDNADGAALAEVFASLHAFVCREAEQWVPFSVIAVLVVHEVMLKDEFTKDN